MITFKKIALKSKAGLVHINYSHAILSRDPEQWWLSGSSWSRQRKIPAAQKISDISSSILVRELIVSLHSKNPGLLLLKYREYLQKLYSLDTWCLTEQTNVLRADTTSDRINHTGCQICIGRSPRRQFPDHAFMPHYTFLPHLLAQQGVRRTPEGEGALAGGI